ncbi:MAG: class I SAM-dependent methyltransferase [Deltaproteobacteria bacterium]|nr:class I SAM-dependent methyltransferase [Deltaproteobacteria bacterium]MBW2595112.1 class I SAM-dependent methyltransferase [Deltaproteobacteria bacterium]MBW2649472.1 class I SAM-dependent methyltransferase [Deltaproteobacteria bacterium]
MSVEKDREERVQWIYSSSDNKELEERYDQWAKDYDTDLDEGFGYLGPQRAVEFFTRLVSKTARILDAGAGTGMVGELLIRQGYNNLTAMDLSSGMLEEARKKNAYQEFHQMMMGGPLGFATDFFDAVISVGVLTVGHAPASSFDELIRITRPDGYIVFSLRPDVYRDSGFKEKQAALESEGRWKLVEVSEEFKPMPKGEPDVYHQIWAYQVVSS